MEGFPYYIVFCGIKTFQEEPNKVVGIVINHLAEKSVWQKYHFPWDRSHSGGTSPSDKGTGPNKAILEKIN